MKSPRLVVLASLLALAASAAHAGQVRINVRNNAYDPVSPALAIGDHAVWIWTQGNHTVTSGDGNTSTPDGLFGTSFGSNQRFSWKATGPVRVQEYYCEPHAPGMTAFLDIVASGAVVSDFRITEVYFEAPGDQDHIAITNLGGAAGNLGQYRISVQAGAPLLVAALDVAVPIGGKVTLHLNQSGTNTATDLFFPGVTLASAGSVGLYVPSTVNTSLAAADLMIDFVQWGQGGQLNEATANAASFWTPGEFAPAVAQGHSIQFCGTAAQHGMSFWKGLPTPGAPDCLTPTAKATWGRLKSLYR